MPIKISIAELANPHHPHEAPKFYARSQSQREVTLTEISKEVAWGTALTAGDVENAINSVGELTAVNLHNGNMVDLGDFGKFQTQLSSEGADTIEKFTQKNIKKVNFRFRPGKLIRKALDGVQFEQVISLKSKQEAKKKFREEDQAG